jgi:hypothetical protein
MSSTTRIAPEGKVWVCLACGKTSKDSYGIESPKETSKGWDASCLVSCQLFDKDKIKFDNNTGLVVEIL